MALIKGKQLANATISSSKIADDAITNAKLADNAVLAAQINAGAVTTGKIADSNITTAKIADDAVTFAKIADGAIVVESEGIGSNNNDTTIPTSAAVKDYVDSVAQGLDVKASVRAATTSNATLASGFEAGDSLDSITLVAGDRILIKNQTDASENGIYTVNASGAPTRAADAGTGDLTSGSFVFVEEGGQANTGWVLTTTGSITVGTTDIAFSQFSDSGSSSLGALTDVSLSSPAPDHVLRYAGSSWSNVAIGSFVDLGDLGDVAISSIADNQFLRYDNATSSWKNETVSIGSSQAEYIETVGDSTQTLGIAQASGTATVKTTAEITLAGNAVSALANGDYVEVTSSSNTGIDATDIINAGMAFVTQQTGSSVDVPQGAILEVTNATNLSNAGVNGLSIARIYTPANDVDASKVNLFFNGLRQRLSTNLDGFGFRRRNSGSTSGFASSDTTAGLVHGQDFLVYTVTNSIQLETDDSIVATYVV